MRRVLAVAVLGVLCLPIVEAQERAEDFEDDTVGQDPTSPWYTFTKQVVGSGSAVEVKSGGLDTTEQSLAVERLVNVGTNRANARFNHEGFQPDNATFYFSYTAPNGVTIFFGDSLTSQTGLSAVLQFFPTTVTLNPGGNGCVGEGDSRAIAVSGEILVKVSFNWVAKQYTVDLNDGTHVFTKAFCRTASSEVRAFTVCAVHFIYPCSSGSTGGGSTTTRFDQFQYNGELPLTAPVLLEPAEFDAGFVAFVTDLGFASPQSQMFFTLILIGVVTVSGGAATRWMTPGKAKNWTTMSLGLLVAVFCVFMAFLQLWMMVLASVLGIFIVAGNKEIVNTYHGIKARVEALRGAEPDAEPSGERPESATGEAISPAEPPPEAEAPLETAAPEPEPLPSPTPATPTDAGEA